MVAVRTCVPPVLGDKVLSTSLLVTFVQDTIHPQSTYTPESSLYSMFLGLTLSPEVGRTFLVHLLIDKEYMSIMPSQLKYLSTWKFTHFSLPPPALDSLGEMGFFFFLQTHL